MKRLSLIAMLLLGGTLNAHADNDVYDNITKSLRDDDVLQVDTDDCSRTLGAPRSGTPSIAGIQKLHARTGAGATATRCCMKTPGGWNSPGRRVSQNPGCGEKALEHAEYDGADKGDCHIRGHNAQSADERT